MTQRLCARSWVQSREHEGRDGWRITAAHLGLERISRPQPIEPSSAERPTLPIAIPLRSRKGDAQRQRILEALDRCAGNQTQAAELLGMSRRTLVSRLDLYGISRSRKRS